LTSSQIAVRRTDQILLSARRATLMSTVELCKSGNEDVDTYRDIGENALHHRPPFDLEARRSAIIR